MRLLFSFLFLCLAASCAAPGPDVAELQAHVDSLQRKIDNSYRPGLGEFMSGIQVHHAKLWFAGTAGNWDLADFETKEIREAIDDINQYCADRPEVVSIPMIKAPLDSIDAAIHQKNVPQFKNGFVLLTNTCNNCHRSTRHAFNVIQLPLTPPFSNQVFTK
jgi:hypothetical protein